MNSGWTLHAKAGDRDIQVLKTYGAAPYAAELKKLEKEIKDKQQTINEKIGMFSGNFALNGCKLIMQQVSR